MFNESEKMKISLIDKENNIQTICLFKIERTDSIRWKYDDELGKIEIITDLQLNKIESIEKSDNWADSENEIKQKFQDAIFEYKMSQLINTEDGFDDADDDEKEEFKKYNPYNPKLIRVDTKTFSIDMVNEMIIDGEIDLSPDFQRGFVWTDITRKSRLIESLLLRIPVPAFYFAQDEEGMFQVVDGVQRLTVINSFMKNEFKLKNLEYLTECNGKWFKNEKYKAEDSLDGVYTRRIKQTQLFVNIIDPQTPGKVKYDIFKRINTGGKALNNQEIRNCLANTKTRDLLRELAKSNNFLNATRGSISATRMADEELVLRFVAFYLIDTNKSTVTEYKGGMDLLLDETVEVLNQANVELLIEIRKKFLLSMDNAFYLFGDTAFRKANYINKALFLGISRVLSQYTFEEIKEKNKENIVAKLNDKIVNDIQFRNALSMATNDARNVKIVYDMVGAIMEE
ncbi:MAG: DUF262 domain-containing protein [Lachnospiraceae bacterium]|nr:DUF262 domain-containing protein [Lachnospiraceae bacterium]